jgi:hypothetical protein
VSPPPLPQEARAMIMPLAAINAMAGLNLLIVVLLSMTASS